MLRYTQKYIDITIKTIYFFILLSFLLPQPCSEFQPGSGCLQADWSCAVLRGGNVHGRRVPAVCVRQELLQRRAVPPAQV